jgi:metal-dependent amidase/aminoacylase/carboxypeptidase family protein
MNDIDYKSANPVVMYACDHDAHMMIMFGAAELLSIKNELKENVKFIFQLNKENFNAAKAMIKASIL